MPRRPLSAEAAMSPLENDDSYYSHCHSESQIMILMMMMMMMMFDDVSRCFTMIMKMFRMITAMRIIMRIRMSK